MTDAAERGSRKAKTVKCAECGKRISRAKAIESCDWDGNPEGVYACQRCAEEKWQEL